MVSKRTANLDLEWRRTSPVQYRAVLPNIPDYTTGSSDNFVEIDDTGEGWMFSIWLELVGDISVCLFNRDFDIPYGSSFEEMKQAVENLSIEDIVWEAAEQGFKPTTASCHATRRTASMDLTWVEDDGDPVLYEALLPPIPGYTQDDSDLTVDNTAVAYVYQDGIAGYWDCDIIYGRDMFGVTESNLGHALGRTADEMMMFINSLTPEAIAVALDEYGHDLHPRW